MIYLDMDGVVANFAKAACEAHNFPYEEYPPEEWHMEKVFGCSMSQFWRPINQPGFWENLEKFPWSDQLVGMCGNFTFLSSPANSPHCWGGKMIWVQKYYPGTPLILRSDKWAVYRDGDLLIDDREDTCDKWPGESILFPSVGNKLHMHRNDPTPYINDQWYNS